MPVRGYQNDRITQISQRVDVPSEHSKSMGYRQTTTEGHSQPVLRRIRAQDLRYKLLDLYIERTNAPTQMRLFDSRTTPADPAYPKRG